MAQARRSIGHPANFGGNTVQPMGSGIVNPYGLSAMAAQGFVNPIEVNPFAATIAMGGSLRSS